MAKKYCKECGGTMEAGFDRDSDVDVAAPVWNCRCCWKVFPRKVYVSKKRQERNELFASMFAEFNIDAK